MMGLLLRFLYVKPRESRERDLGDLPARPLLFQPHSRMGCTVVRRTAGREGKGCGWDPHPAGGHSCTLAFLSRLSVCSTSYTLSVLTYIDTPTQLTVRPARARSSLSVCPTLLLQGSTVLHRRRNGSSHPTNQNAHDVARAARHAGLAPCNGCVIANPARAGKPSQASFDQFDMSTDGGKISAMTMIT